MDSFFFSGSNFYKIDEKNRFVIPHQMRYGLVENGKLEFAIGLGFGGCLAIYKKSDLDQIVEKFREKQYVSKFQKFFTLFFSTLHFTSCDKLGRASLTPQLKSIANLKKDVVIAGVMNKIEIWSKDEYEKNMKEVLQDAKDEGLREMTEDAFSLMNEPNIIDIE